MPVEGEACRSAGAHALVWNCKKITNPVNQNTPKLQIYAGAWSSPTAPRLRQSVQPNCSAYRYLTLQVVIAGARRGLQ